MEPPNIVVPESLSQTVDGLNSIRFAGGRPNATAAKAVARWIAGRQGQPGAYGGTFAGFNDERKNGIVLFTGERITSASARHILGEETCRILRWLDVKDRAVIEALHRANDGLTACLERAARDPRSLNPGLYCCGRCSVGLWRNLLSGGLDRQEERLHRGTGHLRTMRDGAGGWGKFPYWYTVLVLEEMGTREAAAELEYTASKLERAAKSRVTPERSAGPAMFAARRSELARRALQRVM